MHRPTRLRVPTRLIRSVMRDQGDLLLHGRRTEPRVAIANGYAFRFPSMRAAFADVLGRRRVAPMLPLRSPFDRGVPTDASANMTPGLRAQFFGVPEDHCETYLSGTMDRVWHRRVWLMPLFWILARVDTLFPETGRDVPATMTVRNYRDADGLPWQTWERTFALGRVRRRFDARMTYDPVRGQTVEHTGPGGRLEVPWRVQVSDNRLQIDALSVSLRIGSLRLPLPDLLSVRVRAIETADPVKPDDIHIDLVLSNRLLGPIFGYEGTFRVERRRQDS
jgi:hypothetical protein